MWRRASSSSLSPVTTTGAAGVTRVVAGVIRSPLTVTSSGSSYRSGLAFRCLGTHGLFCTDIESVAEPHRRHLQGFLAGFTTVAGVFADMLPELHVELFP